MTKYYFQKADLFIKRLNNNEDKDILILDLIETLNDTEKEAKLLKFTEIERVRLLHENNFLKKELGKLKVVKMLMDNAEIYCYQDFYKLQEGQQ